MNGSGNWGVMSKQGRGLARVELIPGLITLEDVLVGGAILFTLGMISTTLPDGLLKIIFYLLSFILVGYSLIPAKGHYKTRNWKVFILSLRKEPREYKSENKNLMREIMK